ncbi:glycoside hydrolase family 9 protein [Oscillatoria sp. CS-180]|uniref:glycoside hydrolase family 9 protein n=1 Tax=Oscillatoria sp. CS-180 TaxID=3021720 RepID=UPI00232E4BEA|nr:glycoside hydrolase family 9 protein [Oscillatoria sp. CS-180]MDB9528263.1 glycoside hydrolase family 9 protein [Oscillatoria sp. CS-180]
MKRAIALLAMLAQFSGLSLGNVKPFPQMLGDRWSARSVDSPLLAQLTEGETLLFAALKSRQRANGLPTVTQVYPVSADMLAVEIETGSVTYGQQRRYRPRSSDQIEDNGVLKRDGQTIGRVVGRDRTILYPLDQYQGRDVPQSWLDNLRSYRLTSPTDSDFQPGQRPEEVFRKSKPIDMADTANGQKFAMRHTVYLQLSDPLQTGETYGLVFEGQSLDAKTFVYNPQQQHSEAVHISHIGFHPDDPIKVGFLSTWIGSGGGFDYSEGMTFWLVDTQTDDIVYEGQTRLSAAQDQWEDAYRNYNETDVYALDFRDFREVGVYRLCVETVGCSHSFPIQESVWQTPFVTSIRGLYHQRSGIELKSPYTQYHRPRAFHPDDGVVVYQSDAKLMDTRMGIGSENAFEALTAGVSETPVPDAWGGYFDAGDWDRRIQHLGVAESLLDLVELFPDAMAAVDLNIPESNNALPDVLDEALWGIDVFRRLQHPDGGVPGGIESAEHPRHGEASWQESLQVMAYAPDVWSSYWYANAAAQAASVLKQVAPARAEDYEQSALMAFAYAEQESLDSPEGGWPHQVRDRRNLAALELWRLTGLDRFHQVFLNTTVFTDSDQSVSGREHNQGRAAFRYAQFASAEVDSQVQANARQALLKKADEVAAITEKTAFQWGKHHPNAPVGWGIGWSSPYEASVLVQAHHLEQSDRYLEAIIRSSQAPLGANPDNLVYTTGLGLRSPQNPLVIDQRIMGVDPPPGITVYGPIDITHEIYDDYWFARYQMKDNMFPEPTDWPITELYVDVYINVAMTEFTIHQTIGPSAYVWGYLAAQER